MLKELKCRHPVDCLGHNVARSVNANEHLYICGWCETERLSEQREQCILTLNDENTKLRDALTEASFTKPAAPLADRGGQE